MKKDCPLERSSRSEPILGAGGLLECTDDGGARRLAVVHRNRYQDRNGQRGDWVLPKGKPQPGETLEATALREVAEETGFHGRIVGPSFPLTYEAGGVHKVVTFFRMSVEKRGEMLASDTSEVREVVWLEPAEAFGRLTYAGEREVLREAYRLSI